MATPLILSADDYAQSADIDHGILKLIRLGRLTATSCLSLSPRWHEAAAAISPDIRQQADIGLHLDFTQFSYPLRLTHPQLVIRSLLRQLSHKQIQATIRLQLDAFEKEIGSAPDYIDGHQHVHQLPQIRDALLSELHSRYSGKLPWLRISHPAHDGMKGLVISALGSSTMRKLALKRGFSATRTLLGVYGFNSNAESYLEQLNQWLAVVANGNAKGQPYALMCHPGLVSADQTDPIGQARPIEYEVLAGHAFNERLAALNIMPVKGSELFAKA